MKQVALIPGNTYRIITTSRDTPYKAIFQGLTTQGLMFQEDGEPLNIPPEVIEYINPASDRDPLEDMIEAKARILAKKLNEEGIREITLRISVNGRTDGDVRISYNLGSTYDASHAESYSLRKAVEEHIRRSNFSKENNPLLITARS